jgi:hypothetical protein
LLKIQGWGVISVVILISLTILPQLGFGQTPTLDKLSLENSQPPQCLDFNQDTICEFIVLANGTMVKNPSLIGQTAPTPTQTPTLDVTVTTPEMSRQPYPQSTDSCDVPTTKYIPFLGLACSSSNSNNIVPAPAPAPAPAPRLQAQIVDEEAASIDIGSDSGRPPSNNPYCDVVRGTDYKGPCFDRLDYSESTGLYPCRDGSNVEDWRDCPDGPEAQASSNVDDDDEIDNDNDGLDDRERNDEIGEDLPQEGGCQGEDDFCDEDEGCQSDDVDCIDDREFDEDDYNG